MEKLTRFETTRLISARALQLSLGAPPLIKATKEMLPEDLAKEELLKGILPMTVLRTMPNGETVKIGA